MDIALYEYDPRFVLERFREGEFDFVDAVSEVEETEFFRYIGAHKILSKLAETYPSPRRKGEVPSWMYIASNLSMRFHGVHSFNVYPYVVRCGGMLNAFGREVAHKTPWSSVGRRGGKRLRSIPKQQQQAELVALTQRYRRFRKGRARLLEVHAKMLAIVDKLEAARRKEP